MALTIQELLEEKAARAATLERLPVPETRRTLRESAALTQRELAAVVGVSPTTLLSWEHGTKTPRGLALERYVDALEELVACQS